MKKLVFVSTDVESKKNFEIVLHGLMIGGCLTNQKGLAVLRREINLLDKLETISKDCECGKKIPGTTETDRELIEGTHCLELDSSEFDLLYNYIGSVPWTLGSSSRQVLKTLDWMKYGRENGEEGRLASVN